MSGIVAWLRTRERDEALARIAELEAEVAALKRFDPDEAMRLADELVAAAARESISGYRGGFDKARAALAKYLRGEG